MKHKKRTISKEGFIVVCYGLYIVQLSIGQVCTFGPFEPVLFWTGQEVSNHVQFEGTGTLCNIKIVGIKHIGSTFLANILNLSV